MIKRNDKYICAICEREYLELGEETSFFGAVEIGGVTIITEEVKEVDSFNVIMCGDCYDSLAEKGKQLKAHLKEEWEAMVKEREKEMLEWDEETREDYYFLQKEGVAAIGEFDEVSKRRYKKKFGR